MLSKIVILGLVGIPALIVYIVLLAIFIFEIAMFISVIRNKHISDTAKVLWAVGMIILHPFVAIAYYFTDYKK